jgi:hypothetical protein
MRRYSSFLRWLHRVGFLRARDKLPAIRFDRIARVSAPPPTDQLGVGDFVVVVTRKQHRWALFQCPCGCDEVITLSLQQIHRPHWSLRNSRHGRPNLQPSVWRDRGCYSHFWVTDGRVYWDQTTGKSPNEWWRDNDQESGVTR